MVAEVSSAVAARADTTSPIKHSIGREVNAVAVAVIFAFADRDGELRVLPITRTESLCVWFSVCATTATATGYVARTSGPVPFH